MRAGSSPIRWQGLLFFRQGASRVPGDAQVLAIGCFSAHQLRKTGDAYISIQRTVGTGNGVQTIMFRMKSNRFNLRDAHCPFSADGSVIAIAGAGAQAGWTSVREHFSSFEEAKPNGSARDTHAYVDSDIDLSAYSLALSTEGNRLAVGVLPKKNAGVKRAWWVYVYTHDGNDWTCNEGSMIRTEKPGPFRRQHRPVPRRRTHRDRRACTKSRTAATDSARGPMASTEKNALITGASSAWVNVSHTPSRRGYDLLLVSETGRNCSGV